jgi:hypothetical protein
MVVVTGVDHAWDCSAGAATMSFVFLGTPPPQ